MHLKEVFAERFIWRKALVTTAFAGAALGFVMPACFQADKLQAAALALAPEWTSALVSIGSTVLMIGIAFGYFVYNAFETSMIEDERSGKLYQYARNVKENEQYHTLVSLSNGRDDNTNGMAQAALSNNKRLMISAAVAIGANVLTNILLAALSSQSLLDITYAGSLHPTMSMSIFAAGFAALAGISAYALQDEQMRNKFSASMAVGTVAAIFGLVISSTIASNLCFSLATTGLTHEMSSLLIGCAFGAAAAGITALANREGISKFFKKAFPGRKPNTVVDTDAHLEESSSDEQGQVHEGFTAFNRSFTLKAA